MGFLIPFWVVEVAQQKTYFYSPLLRSIDILWHYLEVTFAFQGFELMLGDVAEANNMFTRRSIYKLIEEMLWNVDFVLY